MLFKFITILRQTDGILVETVFASFQIKLQNIELILTTPINIILKP